MLRTIVIMMMTQLPTSKPPCFLRNSVACHSFYSLRKLASVAFEMPNDPERTFSDSSARMYGNPSSPILEFNPRSEHWILAFPFLTLNEGENLPCVKVSITEPAFTKRPPISKRKQNRIPVGCCIFQTSNNSVQSSSYSDQSMKTIASICVSITLSLPQIALAIARGVVPRHNRYFGPSR